MSLPLPRTAEPDEPDEPGDAELIGAVRSGNVQAYGALYRRHAGAALALARQLTGSGVEADDLVAEAFAKVLDVLRGGGGPDVAFRAYLLTTVRNTLYDRARRDRRLEWSDDMTRHDPGVPWVDTAVAGLESSLAARAFHRLPERWQTVLWHTEVEQESPAEVAPLLGLTPNGVAALAYRAREGLRQAYLQEHLSDGVGRDHRATVDRLGAWARGGLSARQRARVEAHLATCSECRALARELEDVNAGLRGVVAPLVLGTAAASAYLASRGSAASASSAAVGSGAASGSGAAGSTAAGTTAGGSTAGGGTAGGSTAGGSTAGGSTAGGSAAGGGAASSAAGGGAGAGGGVASSAAGGAAAGGEAVAAGGATAGGAGAGGAGMATGAATGAAATATTGAATGAVTGAVAGGAGVAGGAAAGSAGSAVGSVVAWIAGTHVGQAAAAVVAAAVIGGTTAVATHDGGRPPTAGGASSTANASLPGPSEGGRPAVPSDPGGHTTPRPGPGGPNSTPSPGERSPDAEGKPGRGGGRGAPTDAPTGAPTGTTGAPGGPTGAPSGSAPPNPTAGEPVLTVDRPRAQDTLQRGAAGGIAVSIHNTGQGDAVDLVAVVRLPAGFTAGSGNGGEGWECNGVARTATCTRTDLGAGETTTLVVPANISGTAAAGTVTGTVRSARDKVEAIPATRLEVAT